MTIKQDHAHGDSHGTLLTVRSEVWAVGRPSAVAALNEPTRGRTSSSEGLGEVPTNRTDGQLSPGRHRVPNQGRPDDGRPNEGAYGAELSGSEYGEFWQYRYQAEGGIEANGHEPVCDECELDDATNERPVAVRGWTATLTPHAAHGANIVSVPDVVSDLRLNARSDDRPLGCKVDAPTVPVERSHQAGTTASSGD